MGSRPCRLPTAHPKSGNPRSSGRLEPAWGSQRSRDNALSPLRQTFCVRRPGNLDMHLGLDWPGLLQFVWQEWTARPTPMGFVSLHTQASPNATDDGAPCPRRSEISKRAARTATRTRRLARRSLGTVTGGRAIPKTLRDFDRPFRTVPYSARMAKTLCGSPYGRTNPCSARFRNSCAV